MSLHDENESLAKPADDGERENFCERLEAYIGSNPFRAILIALVSGILVSKIMV